MTTRNILFLAHRLPFPPDKGDKVRSYHLLRHLAERHRVFVGTFIDDPADEPHAETVRGLCAGLMAIRLYPRLARVRSLAALITGMPLTLAYYRSARLQEWVTRIAREHHIDTVVVFSSAMAQYVAKIEGLRMLVDFVDVDSAKWTQYADKHPWPLSWIYRREASRLLAFERVTAERAMASFFVTDAEVRLFRSLTPGCDAHVETMCNGVDSKYFSPGGTPDPLVSPFLPSELPVVFTGAMDYWPNIDAVVWFAQEVLPGLVARNPAIRFYIVGRNPGNAVLALRSEHVIVTGSVPDVRPYLRSSAVVVAPLRVARGVQNKVLEAMSVGRPVVIAESCAAGIDGTAGRDFEVAGDAQTYIERICALLSSPQRAGNIGRAGRQRVLAAYDWTANLARIDRYIAPERVLLKVGGRP